MPARIIDNFPQRTPFIGRDAEMGRVKAALDQLSDGTGAALLVGGQSGVGKSRFLAEAHAHAVTVGAQPLTGQAIVGGGARYQAWRDVLPALVSTTPLTDLEAGILMDIVPNISMLLGRYIPEATPISGTGQHQRLIETVVELFTRQTRPIVLCLDDLHWASESLDVLDSLLPLTQTRPLVIIGAYQSDERPELPARLPDMQHIPLAPFSSGEMSALCAAILGDDQPILQGLERITGGNAFFVVEFILALAEEAGGLAQALHAPLPDSLQAVEITDLLERRIGRLPAWGLPLLQLAAMTDRRIDLKIIDHALLVHPDLMESDSIEAWLDACAVAQLFEMSGDAWQFRHDTLRDEVIRHIAADSLPILHRAIAEAIESLYPDDRGRAEVLMTHWRLAGHPEKELHYTGMVIEWLLWTKGDYEQANRLTEYALTRLPEKDARRTHLLNHLSEIGWRTGDYAQTTTYGEQAVALGLRYKAYDKVGRGYSTLGIAARLQGDYAASEKHLNDSLAIHQKNNDDIEEANSLSNLGDLFVQMGEYDKAWRLYQRAVKIQKQRREHQSYAHNLHNLARVSKLRKDSKRAQRYLKDALDISQSLKHRYAIAVGQHALGVIMLADGEKLEARSWLQAALENFMLIRDQNSAALVRATLANAFPTDDAPPLEKLVE